MGYYRINKAVDLSDPLVFLIGTNQAQVDNSMTLHANGDLLCQEATLDVDWAAPRKTR